MLYSCIKLSPVIVGIVCATVAVYWGRRVADRRIERVTTARRRVAELVARCDAENALVSAGDERGLSGDFPPAAL